MKLPLLNEKSSPKVFACIVILGLFGIFLLVGLYSPPVFSPTPSQWTYLRSFLIARHNYNHSSNKTADNTGRRAVPPLRNSSLIVNTSTCKIPNINPWAESIALMKCGEPHPKCEQRNGGNKWMYLNGSKLIFNDSVLHGLFGGKSSLQCCYHVINRLEQTLNYFDSSADDGVELSKSCHPISLNSSNNITDEFIRVVCTLSGSTVYDEYFATAQPNEIAENKIARWKTLRTNDPGVETPPNVVILGIDCNSRLNSHRRLPRTLKVLQNLDAVEMLGYTKVGDNTFPNTVAFLAGMATNDMLPQCNPKRNLDGCPFIWKDFARAGYLTATAEDSPVSTSFNYRRDGFVLKPVDFYYRPFILASAAKWNVKCVGHHSTIELLLNYLDDIVRRGSYESPVFIHSWATFYSHDCIHSLRFVDDTIAKFVEAVDNQNTILVMMSDHGYRIGKFRESAMGWYEDRLPTMWIYLPDRVRKRWPQWQSNLQLNAERLTSHFDLYHTLVQILQSYTVDPNFHVNTTSPTKGQSLLEPVPENRTCSQAAIPEGYCTCSEPKPINLNSVNKETITLIGRVAYSAITFLAKALPNQCTKLAVKRIVSAKRMESADGMEMFVVKFYTTPGDYLFEATSTVKENGRLTMEGFDSIARVNSMDSHSCVMDAVFERFCYC